MLNKTLVSLRVEITNAKKKVGDDRDAIITAVREEHTKDRKSSVNQVSKYARRIEKFEMSAEFSVAQGSNIMSWLLELD